MALIRSPDPSTTSILTKFDDKGAKMWTLVCKQGFFHIWAVWPSFWPQETHIQTWPRNHQKNLPDKFPEYLDQNCSHKSINKLFLFLATVT
jgi:hypothetical protein